MDPITAFTGLKVASAAFTGISGFAQGKAQQANLENQAILAETQAFQRDTYAREELTRFLGSVRAARSANGLSANSPNAYLLNKSARVQSDRDRLIQRNDSLMQAANYRAAAASAGRGAAFSLATGAVSAGIPIAEYGIYNGGW